MKMLNRAFWPTAELLNGVNRLAQPLGGELRASNNGMLSVEQYAETLGIDAVSIHTKYGDLQKTLSRLIPGIVEFKGGDHPVYIFISGYRNNKLTLLLPEGGTCLCDLAELTELIREDHGYESDPVTEQVLIELGLPAKRLARAQQLLIQQQLAVYHIKGLWLLRPNANQGLKVASGHAQLGRYAMGFAGAHIGERAALIGGVSLLGYAITQGMWTTSLIITWLLIMLSHLAFSAIGQACQVQLEVRLGVMIKRHLQHSALRLSPEAHSKKGPAQLLGQAMEANGLQDNALPGVFTAVNAALDILIGLVIALFIQHWLMSGLLIIFMLASSYPILQYNRTYQLWAKCRKKLTHLTIEHMQGNRTRLMQSGPSRWHKEEERRLQHYWQASVQMDKFALWLRAIIPSLWLISASAILCSAIMFAFLSLTQLAALLGVILLVWQAWHGIANSCQQLARSWYSWQEIQDLVRDSSQPQVNANQTGTDESRKSLSGLAINQVSYAYTAAKPILHDVSMYLQQGRQYVLQGESGSGKSTLLALLAGQAIPRQGWLLCNERDIQTLGYTYWRKKICWVPQYHDNYLFSATLVFNLLLGRAWPPSSQDIKDARNVCDKLGLTPLLNKMPAGILQPVGEMGWQLSQGECSRVYLARALLQNPDFLLLDESLGALDSITTLQILAALQTEPSATLLCMHL